MFKTLLLSLLLFLAPSSHHVSKGSIIVTCPLTVGSSFQAKTSSLSGTLLGDPSSLSGTLTSDLSTLKTGIAYRDSHLKDKYLEVSKFPQASMTSIKVKGGTFSALFTLHGVQKPVAGTVSSSGTSYVASFPLSISSFSILKPTYLGVGVKDQIKVRVTFSTSPF